GPELVLADAAGHLGEVDAEGADTGDAGLAGDAGDDGGVAGHAAAGGEDAGRRLHDLDVGGAGLGDDEDAVATAGPDARRVLGGEDDHAAGGTGRDSEAGGDDGGAVGSVQARM